MLYFTDYGGHFQIVVVLVNLNNLNKLIKRT